MTPTRKVCIHVCSNRWLSAITDYAISAAQALERKGWKNLLFLVQGSAGYEKAKSLGLEVIGCPRSAFQFGSGQFLRKSSWLTSQQNLAHGTLITYEGAESLISHALCLNFRSQQFIRFLGRQDHLEAKTRGRWQAFLFAHRHCRSLLVPSKYFSDSLPKVVHDAHRINVIDIGRDEALFGRSSTNIHRPGAQAREIGLCLLGRLDPIKGHREFLHIYAKMLEIWRGNLPAPKVTIVGQSQNLTSRELRDTAQNLGLSHHVEILEERVSNPSALMQTALLGVIPSLGSEVICRVAIEFLMSGTPIFTSRAGSLACYADHPITSALPRPGVCFSHGDSTLRSAESLMKAIKMARSMSDPERKQLSIASQQKFGLQAMGTTLETHLLSPN